MGFFISLELTPTSRVDVMITLAGHSRHGRRFDDKLMDLPAKGEICEAFDPVWRGCRCGVGAGRVHDAGTGNPQHRRRDEWQFCVDHSDDSRGRYRPL
ncbi:hypothetical protein Aglo03_59340 [Actinokineospora globicatena]|uniref:Uncharacterized protein n=1 Tax=Actinokineospora globicatena TaxID=103729 RepID=A0A9W6VDL4_9PSEU|nr:hypothetical protein Aglo03_59340 [Actinokineospora globicatena]